MGIDFRQAGIAGLVLLIAWSAAERWLLPAQTRAAGARQDRGSFFVLAGAWGMVLVFATYDGLSLRLTVMPERWAGLAWIGLALVASGIAVRFKARLDLGRHFSFTVQTTAEQALVTRGIYRKLRHPAYLGALLLFAGLPLCFGSLAALAASLLVCPATVAYRIRVEERALAGRFGAAWAEYAGRTWRLVPWAW